MTDAEAQVAADVDPDCIFCAIAAGSVPALQVYADEHAVAFLDRSPWHRGHTLVIPRRHVADLVSGSPALAEIGPAIDAVARLLAQRLGADGINLLSSAGQAAGQTVFHLHVHVVPRYPDRPGLHQLVQHDQVGEDELESLHRQLTADG